nr:Chain A, Phenol-soluble modulin alpha 1 peptide [Staphylococcus aureus]
IIKVIK